LLKGVPFFTFTITHPQSSISYNLSAKSRAEAAEWVKALQAVIEEKCDAESKPATVSFEILNKSANSTPQEPRTHHDPVEINVDPNPETKDTDSAPANIDLTPESSDPMRPLHLSCVHEGLTDELRLKADTIAEQLYNMTFNANPSSWVTIAERDGVIVSREVGGTGVVCARGETVMPYTIPEIFQLTSRSDMKRVIDTTMDEYRRVKYFSPHSGIEYTKSKAVWPTSSRDFSNLTHWRLLNNGMFTNFATSVPFSDCPEVSGAIRGILHVGGYFLQHVPGGTRVFIVMQVRPSYHLSKLVLIPLTCFPFLSVRYTRYGSA
jgi:hypothetical protein